MSKGKAYLSLPPDVKRMAKMAAAYQGLTLSQYIAKIIKEDCESSGVADLARSYHKAGD